MFVRKKAKKSMKKLAVRVHTSLFFQGRFFSRGKKSLSSLRSLHHHDVFLHFSKGREREREIDICREDNTYYNKSTRRARAQNNETGNT